MLDRSSRAKMATSIDSKKQMMKQGAEARIYKADFFGKPAIVKERFSKKYRHPLLDDNLCKERTKSEVRAICRCNKIGIPTPSIYFVEMNSCSIWLEYVEGSITVKEYISAVIATDEENRESDPPQLLIPLADKIGGTLAKMHNNSIIHGDLTTSNMLLYPPHETSDIVVIDYGLSYVETDAEDKGVDLYVLERAFASTHPTIKWLLDHILQSYAKECKNACEVMKKLHEIRLRGRKRTMVG